MGIFNFRKEKSSVKNFDNYFSFSFCDVPDESFTSSKEMNTGGSELTMYRKALDKKELGMFDTVEVIMDSALKKSIILKTTEPNWVNCSRVMKLVDHIYSFLGEDDENKGKWNCEDQVHFESEIFWARYWLEERHNPKIMLSFSKAILDDDVVSTFELRMMIPEII
jgi:hypothetical protein